MVAKKMKKTKGKTVEAADLAKYPALDITKIKKSKVFKDEQLESEEVRSDLELLMKEEAEEDTADHGDEKRRIKMEPDCEEESSLDKVPSDDGRPPTPVSLEGAPSTGTATGWVETNTLPQGWKYRECIRGGQTVSYFLSPKAKIFPCRRLALKYLMEVAGDLSEAEAMREKLVHEGWRPDQALPRGWRWRPDSKVKNSREFMDDKGIFYRSYRQAAAVLRENPEDLEKLKQFAGVGTHNYQQSNAELKQEGGRGKPAAGSGQWTDADYFPAGWKRTKAQVGFNLNRCSFLHPDGKKIFASRRKALEFFIREGAAEEELEMMREGMVVEEGWERSHLLPPGWLIKSKAARAEKGKFSGSKAIHHSLSILTSEGITLYSQKNAVEYMEKAEGYTEEDILNLGSILGDKLAVRRTDLNTWVKSETLPTGWKSRPGPQGRIFFLAPDGQHFVGGRLALQHMLENVYPLEEVEKMRDTLCTMGWQRHPLLPAGWISSEKNKLSKTSSSSSRPASKIISREGRLLEGGQAAREYMSLNPAYNEEDLLRLNQMLETNSMQRRLESADEWLDNKVLPAGWRMRIHQSGKKFFLSPDGRQFGSRKLAYQHMIRNNYPNDEINFMRMSMQEDGWNTSEHLPKDWLFRQTRFNDKSTGHMVILSSEGDKMESYLAAIKFMEKSEKYTEQDILRVSNLVKEVGMERRKNTTYKSPVETKLPEGWKTRPIGSKLFYVAPNGEQMANMKKAYQFLLREENRDSESLEVMKQAMLGDGWQVREELPEGWLFRQRRTGTSCDTSMISSDGEQLKSFIAAIKYMEDREDYTEEDIDKVNMLIEAAAKDWRKTNITSSGHSTNSKLPTGWRSRPCGRHLFIVSPEGEQFNNRRKALVEMVRRGMQEEDLDLMRLEMEKEGWKKSEYLPANWRCKLNSGSHGHNFLTGEGELVNSSERARKILEGEEFSQEDRHGLKMFLDIQTVSMRSTSYVWNEDDNSVPAGWKTRFGGKKQFFLSPDGQMFPCRRKALEQLIKEGAEYEEVEEMRSLCIRFEGFETSPLLPTGWIHRPRATQHGSVQILSVEGVLYQSFITAKEFMEGNSNYGLEDTNNLDKLVELSGNAFRQTVGQWQEDITLPEGWKSRISEGKMKSEKQFFLSPAGEQFACRRLALKSMVEGGAGLVEVEEMRSLLVHEGWQRHPDLPKGWHYRGGDKMRANGGKSYGHSFVNEFGEKFASLKAAVEFLMKSDGNEAALEKLSKFSKTPNILRQDVSKLKRQPDIEEKSLDNPPKKQKKEALPKNPVAEAVSSKFEEEESLPKGWKIRRLHKAGVGEVEIFLTPEQKMIANRQLAIDHMVKMKYSGEEVTKMQSGLKRFGWEEDPLLPPGFLRKGTEYYTPENQRVEGVAKMLEWLLDRDYPFTVTGPLAREVSWGKIKVERRLRLQGLLNLQMMREGGEGST